MRIKDSLMVVAEWAGNEERMRDQLEYTGEAIESEFKDIRSRIEALEESEKQIEYLHGLTDLQAFKKCLQSSKIEKPVPTDKDGKPEGGLEKGDVVSYDDKGKILGQFTEVRRDYLWGYWQDRETGGLKKFQSSMPKDEVTFEFRPRGE